MTITKVWNLGASLDILGSHSVSIFNHIDAIAWNPSVKAATCPLLSSLHEYKISTSLLCFTLLFMLLDIMIVLIFSNCCLISYPKNIMRCPSLTNTLDLLQLYMVVLGERILLSSEEMLHKGKCDLAHRGAFLQRVVYTYRCTNHFMEKQQGFHQIQLIAKST